MRSGKWVGREGSSANDSKSCAIWTQVRTNAVDSRTVIANSAVLHLLMRKLSSYLQLVIVSLLIGGYVSMYAGSIAHDLGHLTEHVKLADKHGEHDSCADVYSSHAEEKHIEVSCFFCSHAPVLANAPIVEQTWTLSVAAEAPPLVHSALLESRSLDHPSLRGPPEAC